MGDMITITASDGFSFSAYQALPESSPKASVLIIQEIFGVNQHIQEVCDGYAEKGFAAIAPAIFDRLEKNVELNYDTDGIKKGKELAWEKLNLDDVVKDLGATAEVLEKYGKPATIGYCFGGFLSYIAATELHNLSCSVAYYGGNIAKHLSRDPLVPIMFHFSDDDPGIPMSDVEKIQERFPELPLHVYSAHHGFNCNLRSAWHAESAELALERTLEFIDKHQ